MGKPTRVSFGEALAELGEKFKNIVVLDADLSKSTKSDLFAQRFPERFFHMGIEEANIEARLIFEKALGLETEKLFLLREIDDKSWRRIRRLISRRIKGEPIFYITGRREFYGIELEVEVEVLSFNLARALVEDQHVGEAEAEEAVIARGNDLKGVG